MTQQRGPLAGLTVVELAGIGPAFWGLVAGVIALLISSRPKATV